MPKGWPRAIVPPCMLSFTIDAEVLGRRDDLSGKRLVDLDEIDLFDRLAARASAGRLASIGPRPMISGSIADTPDETTRASGVMPSAAAFLSLITTTAAAPSFSGQALPAVISPSGRNTGLSWASPSSVVLGRVRRRWSPWCRRAG